MVVLAVLDGFFRIAQIESDAMFARSVEQVLGRGAGHFRLEKRIDFVLAFHVPTRKEGGQCHFGEHDDFAPLAFGVIQ